MTFNIKVKNPKGNGTAGTIYGQNEENQLLLKHQHLSPKCGINYREANQ